MEIELVISLLYTEKSCAKLRCNEKNLRFGSGSGLEEWSTHFQLEDFEKLMGGA